MVERIEQQTLPRGAAPSNRFASPKAFGANNAGQSFEQFGYHVSDTLMARAQADADVEAHKQVVDDIVYLENQRNETLQQSEPGAPKFTERMKFLYEDLTKKRTEDLSELQKRSYMNRMNAYMPKFIRASAETERQEATRYTKQTIIDTAEKEAMLFDGFDYGRILQEAPMAIAATKEVIANSPLSPAEKQEMLDKVPAMTRESAVRAAARKDPYSLAKDAGKRYTPDVDGITEFILDREGDYAPKDGPRETPAIFGINRESWKDDHDKVIEVFNSGDKDKAKKLAANFYKEKIIKANGIDKMPQDVALVVADGVVNHRPAIQRQLVKMAKEGATAEELIDVRQKEYDRLNQFPDYQKNYAGWMARLQHVEAAIGTDTAITGNPLFDMAETPEEQERFRQIIESEKARHQVSYRVELESSIQDNLAMVAEGQSDAKLSQQDFERAYGEAAPMKYREYEQNHAFMETSSRIKVMTNAEMIEHLRSNKPRAVKGFARANEIYRKKEEAISLEIQSRFDDPMKFAMREGLASDEPIDFSSQDLERQLRYRADAAAVTQFSYNTPYKPLTKQEVETLGDSLTGMAPEQELHLIDSMQRAFDSRTGLVMQQIGQKDAVFAHIGGMVAAGGDRNTALKILRGRRFLASDAGKKAVKTDGIDDAFREATGDAFLANPEAASATQKAAVSLYYIKALQSGSPEKFQKDLYEESVNEVLGGKEKIVKHNNANIILPPKITKDQFEDFLDEITEQDLKSYSSNGRPPTDKLGRVITPSQFKKAKLTTVGTGRYAASFATGQLMAGSEPYIFEIK